MVPIIQIQFLNCFCIFWEYKLLNKSDALIWFIFFQGEKVELNEEEITTLAHHKPQVCAVGKHVCPTMNSRFVKWLTICPAAINMFVPWVTTCFLSQRKNRWQNHLNQRTRNLLWKLLKKKDSQTETMSVNSSEQDWYAMLTEKHCAVLQRIWQTKTYRSIREHLKYPGRTSRSGRFRLRRPRSHVHWHWSVVTIAWYCIGTNKP